MYYLLFYLTLILVFYYIEQVLYQYWNLLKCPESDHFYDWEESARARHSLSHICMYTTPLTRLQSCQEEAILRGWDDMSRAELLDKSDPCETLCLPVCRFDSHWFFLISQWENKLKNGSHHRSFWGQFSNFLLYCLTQIAARKNLQCRSLVISPFNRESRTWTPSSGWKLEWAASGAARHWTDRIWLARRRCRSLLRLKPICLSLSIFFSA